MTGRRPVNEIVLRALAVLCFACVALTMSPGDGFAQALGLGGNSDQPVEINADKGIEWHQKDQVYIARGNASAKRGNVTLRGQTLTAHYRPTQGGGTDIWRIDAAGDVSITSAATTASGDNGVYDVHSGVMVLRGRHLKLVSQKYTVTARDTLEYYEAKRMAVARGDAEVTSGDRRLKADIISAYFKSDSPEGRQANAETAKAKRAKTKTESRAKTRNGTAKSASGAGKEDQSELEKIEAFNHVVVTSPGQVALADRGVYDVETGIVTLYGSVKITRGENQLNGEYGEVNLNTGISRLLSGPPGTEGSQPVRGLFTPNKKPEITPRRTTPEKGK